MTSRHGEDAPLLADDAANGDLDSEDGDYEGDSKGSKFRSWLGKAWEWFQNNLMVVAIILLLIGGLVALCVYFAGAFHVIAIVIKLKTA